ncbi:transposase [Duganella sp. FT50W]|uniref:Transposase n=1 Tax=Duganella lactea TaxID=2692173 RepID=A0A6L8MR26_9BURK|nr:TnsA endonuclease N-terminal domain-containing protein [Duganella lactea]MYM84128.1 transposase [Duganella lactea]
MTHVIWQGTWKGRTPNGLEHQRARSIVRPTGGIMRGKFPSRKTGRMVHHEGMLELDAIYHFETSPLVAQYTEQPQTVHYADGPTLRRYTPDFELKLANGESILVEVKPHKFAYEPDTKSKLDKVTKHFEREQRNYVILTDRVLQIEPRLSNLRRIYHLAPRLLPTYLKCVAKLQQTQALFPISLGAAIAPLSHVELDPYSLLLMGLLTCDLNSPLDDSTILILKEENEHAWFRLSDRFGF